MECYWLSIAARLQYEATRTTYVTGWTCKGLRQYLNWLPRISNVPEEIWVLVLSKGTESRLFLADLFNELIDSVEVS